MGKQYYNTPDAGHEEELPPPAYQEAPPFNPNYLQHHSPPHTPDQVAESSNAHNLYPQIPVIAEPPSSPPLLYSTVEYHQPIQPHGEIRYQTIEIPVGIAPSTASTRRRVYERRRFPLAAIFFLFGWFCPPLWVIGACCCAGSRNEYESFWGKINFLFAMALIVSSIIYSIFAMTRYIS